MRKDKFRAWNKVANFFLSWEDFIDYENEQIKIVGNDYRIFNDKEFDVEQFIGRNDCLHKEIYKGDIVEYCTEEGVFKAVVKFGVIPCADETEGSVGMGIGFYLSDCSYSRDYDEDEDGFLYKVIGNIHENPELLERQPQHDESRRN